MIDAPTALGLSFYQVVVMMVDCVMSYVMDELGLTFKDVMHNHNNLE